MRKSEIQPLSALILSRRNIIDLLLRRQSIPDLISRLIPPDVIRFNQIEQDNVEAADT